MTLRTRTRCVDLCYPFLRTKSSCFINCLIKKERPVADAQERVLKNCSREPECPTRLVLFPTSTLKTTIVPSRTYSSYWVLSSWVSIDLVSRFVLQTWKKRMTCYRLSSPKQVTLHTRTRCVDLCYPFLRTKSSCFINCSIDRSDNLLMPKKGSSRIAVESQNAPRGWSCSLLLLSRPR